MTYKATLSDSSTITAIATFTVTSPNMYSYTSATSGLTCCGTGFLSFRIDYLADVRITSNQPGTVGFVQTIIVNNTYTSNDSTVQTKSTSGSPVLDNNPEGGPIVYQQAAFDGAPGHTDREIGGNDSPAFILQSTFLHRSSSDSFSTYVMYMPSGSSSIWVSLGVLSWNWSAGASKDGSGVWTLDSGSSSSTNPSGASSTTLPTWANFSSNLRYL